VDLGVVSFYTGFHLDCWDGSRLGSGLMQNDLGEHWRGGIRLSIYVAVLHSWFFNLTQT
jgi:hypothetical protein